MMPLYGWRKLMIRTKWLEVEYGFTNYQEIDDLINGFIKENPQIYPDKQLMKRINGELCVFNTVEIIKRYKPKYWIIENPAYGRIWQYIERVLGFEIPFENFTRYNNYDNYPISKPTRFSGNVELNLKNEKKSNDVKFQEWTKSYNERSNIPQSLVCEIFEKVYKEFVNGKA